MFSIPVLTIWLIAAGAVVLAMTSAGLWLIKRGFIPRRQGTEPHCRKCSYILTGIASERCPECGSVLGSRGIVLGHRERRHFLTLMGVVVIALPLTVSAGIWWASRSSIDWYRYAPSFWLMREVQFGSRRAWQELMWRDGNGSLAEIYQTQIIDLAIKQQGADKPCPILNELLDYAAHEYERGQLTKQQTQMLFKQMALLSLRVRSRVALGDQVAVEIGNRFRDGPPLAPSVHFGQPRLDGTPVKNSGYDNVHEKNDLEVAQIWSLSIECSEPGEHTLEIPVHVDVIKGPWWNDRPVPPERMLFQEDRKLTAQFIVLRDPPADFIKLLANPTLDQQIRECLEPSRFTMKDSRLTGGIGLAKYRLPANIAFEVFARVGEHEYSIGPLVDYAGSVPFWTITTDEAIDGPVPASFDLIFRSSKRVAGNTLDQYEIWNGELIYRNVPVNITGTTKP